jgi:hypothetical protein
MSVYCGLSGPPEEMTMWPVNEQQSKTEDGGTPEKRSDTAEEPATETPADTDERTPEEAGYGYGV